MAAKYPTDLGFEATDAEMVIALRTETGLSLEDFAAVIKDIDTVFSVCSKELTSRSKSNLKKKDGMLVIKDYRTGSLELIVNPFMQGIVAGVVANAVCFLFIEVMKKIDRNGGNDSTLTKIDKDVISGDRLKEATSKAVSNTSKNRKTLRAKRKAFGLKIKIGFEGEVYEINED